MMDNKLIFGGSFDPVHLGHINVAIAVQNRFNFNQFIFLPCKSQMLKSHTLVNSIHRIAMLTLALSDYPSLPFVIDECEIIRASPSFMLTTLKDYRQIYGVDVNLTLLMGMDTFLQLPQWHHFEKIFSLANILVVNRKTVKTKTLTTFLYDDYCAYNISQDELMQRPHGGVCFFDAGEYNFSSTIIREKKLVTTRKIMLPKKVNDYIDTHKLYQPTKQC